MKFIVIQHNLNDINWQETAEIHDYIKSKFPDIPVITLPSTSSLCMLEKDEIEEMVNNLKSYIEEFNDD